jgi:hypothetical protein
MIFEGRCHCRALSYVYSTEIAVAEWTVRSCQCSFCRLHGTACVSDPAGALSFAADYPDSIGRYRFAHKTTDFLICRRCGAYLGAIISTPSGRYGIANVNALIAIPAKLPLPSTSDYDGESSDARIQRREANWTPVAL